MKDGRRVARPVERGRAVYLRRPTLGDRDEFLALTRASRRAHRGLAASPTSPDEYELWLERSRAADVAAFLVCRTEDDAIVGSVALSQIFRGNFQSAYLGYQIGAPHAGRGYMTEALKLVLKHAFRTLGLHRVEANVQPGNEASIRVVRRAGFTREGYSRRYLKIGGRWRDHERWAILREEWASKKAR